MEEMDDTGQYTKRLPVSTDMPLHGPSPRQSLDDSNLDFRRRALEHSGSCLRLESPYIENITTENNSNRSCEDYSASRVGDPNDKALQVPHRPYQASIKRPNKDALRVPSQTQSCIPSVQKRESSVTPKHKAGYESLSKKKKHERKSGISFLISKGWQSSTEKNRPAFGMSSVRDTEALMTAEHMRESELLMSRTTCERNSDCTFFNAKELNKSFNEAWRPAKERRVAHDVQSAGLLSTEQKFHSGPVLVNPHTKKTAESDGFSSVRTSFETRTGFTDTGSSLEDKIMFYPRLLDFEEPINGRECEHMQRPMRAQSGVDPIEGFVASGTQLQRSKQGKAAKAFSTDSKLSKGVIANQKLHHIELQLSDGAKDYTGSFLPEFKKEVDRSIKPNLLVEFIEGLVKTFVALLRICLKRTSLFIAPSASITRDNFFVEGSFIIKCRSWITFGPFTLLILSCSCLMLRILFLKMEITRLHELLEKCTIASLDIPPKSFIDEQLFKKSPGFVFQEMFLKHSSKVALPVTFIIVLFLLKKKIFQLQELSRKYIMGTEEDAPIGKRLAYGVDILFSTHPYMKPTALLLATVLLICGGGIALFVVNDDSLSDAMWRAWTYVADSGNHADSEGTWPRIISLLISFGGMLIFALMLGLISDAISEKVDSLRKGKSEVIESGHTLILGWSDKLGSLLKQLAIANQSLGGGVVVVLAERDKEEMELDIAKLEFDFMGTSVICRSGSPLIMADLKKVSVSKARAIIVLAEFDNADQSDARALRVVLSLTGIKEGLKGHIIVEMRDLDNEALVKLVGGQIVETVVAHDVIGRLMIQCARQPGLAQIWEDILGFEKAEFYIKRWPELDGTCFADVLISFPDAVPCGIKIQAEGGRIFINPDDDYVLCEGDEILVIAEDDDSYVPAPLPQVREPPVLQAKRSQKKPQKILLCGWRRDIEDMIMVLDSFLAPGSELWIFSDVPECDREKKLLYGNLNPDNLENIQLVHREGNTVIRRHLESLPLEDFDSILILADEKLEDTVVHADSSSLATLLLIRDIQSKRLPLEVSKGFQNRAPTHSQSSWIHEMHEASNKTIIISEILDSRTKNLVSVSKISDYVLSNELVSMALAMVAEDKQINRVLEELFAEEGNELYIRPAEFYLYDQEEVSFFEIMIRARQRDEIVIGYRKALADQAVINPPDKNALQKWSFQDVFVVLAFEE